jgi:hypothetical protein
LRWSPDGGLELEVDEVGNNNRWAVRLTIAGPIVTLQLSGELGNITVAGSVPQ